MLQPADICVADICVHMLEGDNYVFHLTRRAHSIW